MRCQRALLRAIAAALVLAFAGPAVSQWQESGSDGPAPPDAFADGGHFDPEHAPLHAMHNDWLRRQRAIDGALCCNPNDVEVLHDVRWRMVNGRYEVEVGGEWFRVPPGRLMRPNPDDPPPYGEALLFRTVPGQGYGEPDGRHVIQGSRGSRMVIWCLMPAPLL